MYTYRYFTLAFHLFHRHNASQKFYSTRSVPSLVNNMMSLERSHQSKDFITKFERKFASQSNQNSGAGNNSNNNSTLDGADHSLEGKYAKALFNVAKSMNKLDTVYNNLASFDETMKSSSSLKSLFLSSHFTIPEKSQKLFLDTFKDDFNWDTLTVNFLELLITNKRLYLSDSVFKTFEKFYRSEKGIKYCHITSAKDLSASQKKEVIEVLQKRIGSGMKLLADFSSNPSILGGMAITLDEQVMDFSISSRVERLQNELLEPFSI